MFSVADVMAWLETKNLGAYAPIFKRKKIDGVKLLQLNEDDLRSLGIGVRRLSCGPLSPCATGPHLYPFHSPPQSKLNILSLPHPPPSLPFLATTFAHHFP
jgi:hypothetical protein